MAPRKDIADEDTHLNDGMSDFEEFETGGGAEEPTDSGHAPAAEENILEEGEEGLPGFDEPESLAPEEGAGRAGTTPDRSLADEMAELSPDVPVNLVAVVGKTVTSVGDLVKVRLGQVIDLGRAPGETVDLVANGRLIARGELVEMDGKLGVRILKMVR